MIWVAPGSRYRKVVYDRGLSGRRELIRGTRLLEFFRTTLEWVDHSIGANRRSDGLYHAYNLVSLDRGPEIPIRRLYEMLEGQVAVLSSGCPDGCTVRGFVAGPPRQCDVPR